MAGTLLLTLAGVFVGAIFMYRHEHRLRQWAQARDESARHVIDGMYQDMADEALACQPGSEGLRNIFLGRVLNYYDELAREQSSDPKVRFEMSRALHRAANIHFMLGKPHATIAARRRCVALLTDLVAEDPENRRYRFDYFHNVLYLGNELISASGAHDGWPEVKEAYLEIQHLAELDKDNPTYLDALSSAGSFWGLALSREGRLAQAEEVWLRSADLAEKLADRYPDHPMYRKNVAANLGNLVHALRGKGRLAEAEEVQARCTAIYEHVAERVPKYPDLRVSYAVGTAHRATMLVQLGRTEEAEPLIAVANDVMNELYGKYPDSVRIQMGTTDVISVTGHFYFGLGRLREAETTFRKLFKLMDRLIEAHPDFSQHRANYAHWLTTCPVEKLRDPARAEKLKREAETRKRQSD